MTRPVKLFFVNALFHALVNATRDSRDRVLYQKKYFTFGKMKNVYESEHCEFTAMRAMYGISIETLSDKFADFEPTRPDAGFGTSGLSGAFFAVSSDNQFIIKGMSENEKHKLCEMKDEYIKHITTHRNSLLTRYMAVIKLSTSSRFVIMKNCLRPFFHELSARLEFDLKGTVENRVVYQKTTEIHEYSPGKDVDFQQFKIYLSEEDRKKILDMIEKDTELLMTWNLMDYSMILRMEQLGECDTKALGQLCAPSSEDSSVLAEQGYHVGVRNNIIYAYSFGIIDLLQDYNVMKKMAGFIKAVRSIGNDHLSAKNRDTVPPGLYQRRFMDYFNRTIQSQGVEIGNVVRNLSRECAALSRRTDLSDPCEVPPST